MASLDQYFGTVESSSAALGRRNLYKFFKAAQYFRDSSSWKGNKRFFISFFPSSGSIGVPNQLDVLDYPIRTTTTGSYRNEPISGDLLPLGGPQLSGSKASGDLRELSTAEIQGRAVSTINRIQIKEASRLHHDYHAQYINDGLGPELFHSGTNIQRSIPAFATGSYAISRMNDDNPSLLIELNKDQTLPDVRKTGDKEFVVIPENLHPFIKDNLEYFLTQAGINVGGDTSQIIKLNNNNRELK